VPKDHAVIQRGLKWFNEADRERGDEYTSYESSAAILMLCASTASRRRRSPSARPDSGGARRAADSRLRSG